MPQKGTSRRMLRDAQTGEREKLGEGGCRAEDLMDDGEAGGDEAAGALASARSCSRAMAARLPLRAGGECFYRHGEEFPDGQEREDADGAPEEAVVEEDAGGCAGAQE